MIRKYLSSKRQTNNPKPKTYIIRSILSTKAFQITAVIGLQSIKSMFFEKDKYPGIVDLMKAQNLTEIIEMPPGKINPSFQEDLEIMQFQDQSGRHFIVAIYDNDELWQDPQLLDIFPFNPLDVPKNAAQS